MVKQRPTAQLIHALSLSFTDDVLGHYVHVELTSTTSEPQTLTKTLIYNATDTALER